jgi:cytochrome c peroxidase
MYLRTNPTFGVTTKDGKTVPMGGFFWDGRANTLAEQARGPMLTAHEMNNASVADIVAKVAAADYAPLLRRAAGDDVFADSERAMGAITAALEAFQQSPQFAPFTSKFDAVLRGQARLTAQEERGQTLFVIAQKGNCAFCHTVNVDSRDPRDSLFTDFSFHALGVPRNLAITKASEMDQGLCGARPVSVATTTVDVTRWCGWFKTPTLRNVALTSPYMHNGKFLTLREAVAFYATRDTHPERWYPNGEKFDDLPPQLRGNVDLDTRPYHRRPEQRPALSDDEIDDIVAFLQTLTDGYTP